MPFIPVQQGPRAEIPSGPVASPPVGGSFRPVEEESVPASLEEIQAKEAQGLTLSPAEQRVIYDAPVTLGRVASGVAQGLGEVGGHIKDAASSAYEAFNPGDLIDPSAYGKAATTLGEGFARGTYDLANLARMGYNRYVNPETRVGASDDEEGFRRWMERRALNQGYGAVRNPGENIIDQSALPEDMQASNAGAELSSYLLDPTALGMPGGSAAAKLAGRVGGKAVSKLPGQIAKSAAAGVEAVGAGTKAVGQIPENTVGYLAGKLGADVEGKAGARGIARAAAIGGAPIWTPLAAFKGTELAGFAVEKAGQMGRHLLDKEGGLAFTRAQQLARDPNAPSWMRSAASVWDKSGAAAVGRVGAKGAKGAAGGAGIGAALGGATAETPEEFGAALGTGAAIGGGMGAIFSGRTSADKAKAKARTAAWFLDNQLSKGADPESLKNIDEQTAYQAAIAEYMFEGRVDIKFLSAEAFAREASDPGAAATWSQEGKQILVNSEATGRGAEADFLHEVGHALADSEVSSTPQLMETINRSIEAAGGIDVAKREYAATLIRAREADGNRGQGDSVADILKNRPYEVDAEVIRQDDAGMQREGDPDRWIYTELFAEAMMNRYTGGDLGSALGLNLTLGESLKGHALDITDAMLKGMGVDIQQRATGAGEGASTIFASIPDAIKTPALTKIVGDYVKARNKYRTGKDKPVDSDLALTPDMLGKHPSVPFKDMPDGTKGNDFVYVDPEGRVKTRSPRERRQIEQARAAEVDAALGSQAIDPSKKDFSGEVSNRRTVSGMIQYTGSKMGDWFYRLRSFGAESKAQAKQIEGLIENGGTMDFWYQAISRGGGKGWRKNMRKLLGNLSVSKREALPFAFIVTKQGTADPIGGQPVKQGGNVIVNAFDYNALNRRAREWQARTGDFSLDMWGGSIADFTKDLQAYARNLTEGRPGDTSLGSNKRDVLNAFIIGDNRAHAGKNILRNLLRGKDKGGLIRSFRLDRIESMQQGTDSVGLGKGDYVSMVLNKSPLVEQIHQRAEDFRGGAHQQSTPNLWVDDVKQKITSAATALNQVPARSFYSRVDWVPGTKNIDIGGGHSDMFSDFLAQRGVESAVYDPFNRERAHNNQVVAARAGGKSDSATVNNVLNVIQEKAARERVIAQAADAIKQDGIAFFKVYEGDGLGKGGKTKAGYQNNKKTSAYMGEIAKFFGDTERRGFMIIARSPLKDAVQQATPRVPADQIKVVAAAIRLKDGTIKTGPSHFMAAMEHLTDLGDTAFDRADESAYGFTDSNGDWLSREEAAEVGMRQEQIAKERYKSSLIEGALSENFNHEKLGKKGGFAQPAGAPKAQTAPAPSQTPSTRVQAVKTGEATQNPSGSSSLPAGAGADAASVAARGLTGGRKAQMDATGVDPQPSAPRSTRRGADAAGDELSYGKRQGTPRDWQKARESASGPKRAQSTPTLPEYLRKTRQEPDFSPQKVEEMVQDYRKERYGGMVEGFTDSSKFGQPEEPGTVQGVQGELPLDQASPKTEDARTYADRLEAMPEDVRDNVSQFDNYKGYMLYEGRTLAPEGKIKKVSSDNSLTLWQEYDAVIKVDGEPYGLSKFDDPDSDTASVWAHQKIDGTTEPVETYIPVVKRNPNASDLVREIRKGDQQATPGYTPDSPNLEPGSTTRAHPKSDYGSIMRSAGGGTKGRRAVYQDKVRRVREDVRARANDPAVLEAYNAAQDKYLFAEGEVDTVEAAGWLKQSDYDSLVTTFETAADKANRAGDQQATPGFLPEDQPALMKKHGLKGDEVKDTSIVGYGSFMGGAGGKQKKKTLILENKHKEAMTVELLLDDKGKVQRDPAKKPRARQLQYDILMAPGPAQLLAEVDMTKAPEFAELPPSTLAELAWAAVDNKVDPEGMALRIDEAMPYLNGTERRRVQAAIEKGVDKWYADRIVKEYNDMMEMPGVAEGMGWYERMRVGLKRQFKGDAKIFAQLLGATSAKTAVELNFRYAVEAYEMWKSGAYDTQIRNYKNMRRLMKRANGFGLQEWLARKGYIKDVQRVPLKMEKDGVTPKQRQAAAAGKIKGSGDKPMTDSAAIEIYNEHHPIDVFRPTAEGEDGAKFGQNGAKVIQVLGGDWEALTIPNSPKTPNFAGNLYGRTLQATIDVWAARLMRRVGWEGHTDGGPWRLQPKSETGVNSQDFAISQLAFAEAAERIGMNPDDLQAIVWFGEKHIWDERGWTGEEGGEKSSYDDPFAIYYPEGRERTSQEAYAIMKLRGDIKMRDEKIADIEKSMSPEHKQALADVEKSEMLVAKAQQVVDAQKAILSSERSAANREAVREANKALAAEKKARAAAAKRERDARSKDYNSLRTSKRSYEKSIAEGRTNPAVQEYEATGI